MSQPFTVWLLNPYAAGSHRAWAEGYAAASNHRVRLLSMAGYFWKWRMHGGALELAEQARGLLAEGERPDALLATSMTNLPAFLALLRREIGGAPVLYYMHENQLTYPTPPGSKRDLTYGVMQHLSMLTADRVRFNSAYHMRSWFDELPRLLKHFPDYTHLETIDAARARSAVLPVGCDLRRLDQHRLNEPDGSIEEHPERNAAPGSATSDSELTPDQHPERNAAQRSEVEGRWSGAPLILWNQRWEYDKDPETMLRALYTLADEGVPFRVALAGESFRLQPVEFEQARNRLGPRLVHYGYAESATDYARLLWSADVVLSTAIHEFFGVSVVEAIYCGARPVLPRRLSYPELLPERWREACLYDDFDGLLARLREALRAGREETGELSAHVAQYDWTQLAPIYDAELQDMI